MHNTTNAKIARKTVFTSFLILLSSIGFAFDAGAPPAFAQGSLPAGREGQTGRLKAEGYGQSLLVEGCDKVFSFDSGLSADSSESRGFDPGMIWYGHRSNSSIINASWGKSAFLMTLDPKVLIWKRMADFVSARASSYVLPSPTTTPSKPKGYPTYPYTQNLQDYSRNQTNLPLILKEKSPKDGFLGFPAVLSEVSAGFWQEVSVSRIQAVLKSSLITSDTNCTTSIQRCQGEIRKGSNASVGSGLEAVELEADTRGQMCKVRA